MIRLLAILLLGPVLAACSLTDIRLTPKVDFANAQMARAKIECDAAYPPSQGSFLAHAQCINAAQNWVLRPLMPYPDLLALAQTNREALAIRVDRGELSPGAYYRLTMAEDTPLRVQDATLHGPLSRAGSPNIYYAPVDQPQSAACSPVYSFDDCAR